MIALLQVSGGMILAGKTVVLRGLKLLMFGELAAASVNVKRIYYGRLRVKEREHATPYLTQPCGVARGRISEAGATGSQCIVDRA